MFLCNMKMGVLSDGNFAINFTDCSEADERARVDGNQTLPNTTSDLQKDGSGAMRYTIAVVVLYGIAMLGVFGMGQFRKRKRRNDAIDHETNIFLKNYDEVRRTWERQSRVGVVSALLHQLHNQPVTDEYCRRSRPSVNSLAFLPITLYVKSEADVDSESDAIEMSTFNANDCHMRISDEIEANDAEDCTNTDKDRRKQSRVSLLGSSRRSLKKYTYTCRNCLAVHGVSMSRQGCFCKSSMAGTKNAAEHCETEICQSTVVNGDVHL